MSAEIASLLPQSGPALLIQEVLAAETDRATCLARVPPDSPFRTGAPGAELVPAFLALEMAAQAAALVGERARASGPDASPLKGFVVGARETRFHRTTLPADRTLRVDVALLHDAPPLRVYRFEVSDGSQRLAEGMVSTYLDRRSA